MKRAPLLLSLLLCLTLVLLTLSASGCKSTPPVTSDPATWPVSREQAISIACECLPPEVVTQAEMHLRSWYTATPIEAIATGEKVSCVWKFFFYGGSATREQLGWEDVTAIVSVPPDGACDTYEIFVDGVTGRVIFRYATTAAMWGRMPVAVFIVEASLPPYVGPIFYGMGLFFTFAIGFTLGQFWRRRIERNRQAGR